LSAPEAPEQSFFSELPQFISGLDQYSDTILDADVCLSDENSGRDKDDFETADFGGEATKVILNFEDTT
jgi:uncharacterized C2H2 Zn-finger protein